MVEIKTQIRLHLSTSCPDQGILRIVLDRIPNIADGASDAPKTNPLTSQSANPAFHHNG
ncbi:transposase [Mesorhizobium sp. M1005]|uniref:hypothetical protein n=1 Tax=unclassified Mesorhizobium TaxID=325217 RepID=UPI0033372CD8